MLLFFPNLVRNLPQPALAALVISAGISLFDVAELRRLLAMRTSEFSLAVACGLGVAVAGVLPGSSLPSRLRSSSSLCAPGARIRRYWANRRASLATTTSRAIRMRC